MITVLASASRSDPAGLFWTVLGSVVGLGGVLAALFQLRLQSRELARFRDRTVSSDVTLEDRLDELSKTMSRSARLVQQVSAELEARATTAKKLKEEADTAEALAGIHKEQAEAIRRLLDAELAGTARRIRKDSVIIGFASFVFGGGLTFFVTLLVHPIH